MYKKLLLFTIATVLAGGFQRMAYAQSESSGVKTIPNYQSEQITEPMIALNPTNQDNFITAYSDWWSAGNRYPGVSYTTDGGQT